jgi:phosphoglycerate kinase
MRTIDDFNFSGKRALIRVDFNVPLNDKFEVTDNTRIKAALPTIQKVLKDGGSVVLMSHLGRPKNGPEEKFSLKHLVPALESLLGKQVLFADNCISDEAKQKSAQLKSGEILLLENLRFYKEETFGDLNFSEQLSAHGDIYVNDAFGTAHRAHASTAIIARFFPNNSCFGYLMRDEVANLEKLLKTAEKPFTAIVGGAKVSSKIAVIENLLDSVDHLIVGGGMSHTFTKAMGGNTGKSLVEADKLDLAREILAKAKAKNVEIHLPVDCVNSKVFEDNSDTEITAADEIGSDWMGLDIGPKTIENYTEVILKSKTILWNGPMGVFEFEHFAQGTITVAKAIAKATENGAYSLVGGGDSVAAINQFNMADQVSYVSTGGGAMLEYIEGKELPGVAAILHPENHSVE